MVLCGASTRLGVSGEHGGPGDGRVGVASRKHLKLAQRRQLFSPGFRLKLWKDLSRFFSYFLAGLILS